MDYETRNIIMQIFRRSKQLLVVSGVLLLVLIFLTSCQNTPVMEPSSQTSTAIPIATATRLVAQPTSPTATAESTPTVVISPIPMETQEFIIAPIPSSTPGPTPTAIQVTMLPGDCIVTPALKGQEVQVRKVGSTMCLIWADDYQNETGFRVVLQFGYNGEMFVYDTAANRPGMPYPPILSDTQGGSFEYCVAHKDYTVDIYVLLPNQEPTLVTRYSPALECNRFTIPSATAQPATPTPVLIAYTPAPTECVRTQSAAHMPVYLGDCLYWVDEQANESGFRIELSYLNSGETFLYDVPANTAAFALPSEASPRLEESREQCLRRKDYQVLVYARFAQGPPVIVSGMAFSGECGQGEILIATATAVMPGASIDYANPALGFRFRYPEKWHLKSIPLDAAGGGVQISTHDPAEIGKLPPENFFKIEVGVAGGRLREVDQTLLDWWHAQADYDPARIRQETEVQVGDVSALEVTTEASPGLFQKTVYLPYHHPNYGETVLFIASSAFTQPIDKEIFQQVVSSFTLDTSYIGK